MDSPSELRAELEEQRCLIEQQQIEIRRLERRIEMLLRHTAQIQAEFNGLNVPERPTLHQSPGRHGNGNGHIRRHQ